MFPQSNMVYENIGPCREKAVQRISLQDGLNETDNHKGYPYVTIFVVGSMACLDLITSRKRHTLLTLRFTASTGRGHRCLFPTGSFLKIQNKCAIICQRISISNMHIKNLDLHSFRPICTIKKRCNSCKSCKSVLFSLWGPVQAREGLNTGWYAVKTVMIVHIHQGRHGGLPLRKQPLQRSKGRGNPP